MFVGASAGFNFYLGRFGNYSRIYEALAGAIILLPWIYIASLILLVDMEIDRAMERLESEGKSM